MESQPRFRNPFDVDGSSSPESTRVARALGRARVVDAVELAKVRDPDDLDVCELDEGLAAADPALEELVELDCLIADETTPASRLLPVPHPLIPSDIIEAIAREESALLAEEVADAKASESGAANSTIALDDEHLDVVSEAVSPVEAAALLSSAEILRTFPAEALSQLATGALRHHLGDREVIFCEGARADSFFVVESGALEAMRRTPGGGPVVAMAHLGARDPFGLFGLLCQKTRSASVRAIGEASVMEIAAARLEEVIRCYPAARQVLARFFKERMLENFLAVSPIADKLDALGRAALISHFQDRRCAAGEVLLAPGEVQNGIYLVTSGELAMTRRSSPGKETQLARLRRGQFFGVVSALSGCPTRAMVTASEATTLCCLPQRAFNDFVQGYPILRALPARLQEAGTLVERDVFVGDATLLG